MFGQDAVSTRRFRYDQQARRLFVETVDQARPDEWRGYAARFAEKLRFSVSFNP